MKMRLIFFYGNIDGNIIKNKFLMKLSIEIRIWWKWDQYSLMETLSMEISLKISSWWNYH